MTVSKSVLSEAAWSDPVLAVIEKHEKLGLECDWWTWVDVLEYAARYRTVLTDDLTDEEREAYAVMFVSAASRVEPDFADVHLTVKAASTWYTLSKHPKNVYSRMMKHVNVIEKFAELTGTLVTDKWENIDTEERDLSAAVQHFYKETVKYEKRKLMWTAFHVPNIMESKVFEQIVEDRMLPVELIEQHAFNVPPMVAAQFAAHPNTPQRLRTLLRVSVPHVLS